MPGGAGKAVEAAERPPATSVDPGPPGRQRTDDGYLIREGIRLFPYLDGTGKFHYGVGHRLVEGDPAPLNAEGVLGQLKRDFDVAERDAGWFAGESWAFLGPVRQAVVLEMALVLGRGRLGGFVKMRDAVERRNWDDAADELIRSRWAGKEPARVEYLSNRMRAGTTR